MKTYVLDGSRMASREAAHDEIARALEFPGYYGKNLDALWDMIAGMHAEVILQNAPAMLNALGAYGCKLLETLFEAAGENGSFRFTVE